MVFKLAFTLRLCFLRSQPWHLAFHRGVGRLLCLSWLIPEIDAGN